MDGGVGGALEVGVARTIIGSLPPSSIAQPVSVSPARAITFLPTSVEPVNMMKSTASISELPIAEPSPTATWKTSSGTPHSSRPSRISSEVIGVSVAGLRTTELPAARAGMQSPKQLVSG